MSRITCQACSKQFRTDGGHKWHLQHVHPPAVRVDADDTPWLAASQPGDADHETDRFALEPAPLDDLGEFVPELEQPYAQLDELSKRYSDMNETMSSWGGRLDGIEREIQTLTKAMREVSTLTGAVQTARSKVVQLDGVIDVLSRLVWKLDTRGSTKFLDLIVHVPKERMEEARGALSDELCLRGYGGVYGRRTFQLPIVNVAGGPPKPAK